jgi:hypothetical protein
VRVGFEALGWVARWYIFRTKSPHFGIFWKALGWKFFISLMIFWYTFWPFALFYSTVVGHLLNFSPVWNIVSRIIRQPRPWEREAFLSRTLKQWGQEFRPE